MINLADTVAITNTQPKVTQQQINDKRIERRLIKQKKNDKNAQQKQSNLSELLLNNHSDGCTYYMHNNMLHVQPYKFVFTVYPKQRWLKHKLIDILQLEFKTKTINYYKLAFQHQRIYISNNKSNIPHPASDNYIIQHNDTIHHCMHRHEPAVPINIHDKIVVIYCDDDIVVIDKPAGIPVHPCM